MDERPDALVELLEEKGANWEERDGRSVVADFEDEDAEYWRLRRDGAVVVDRMARDTLVITGEEAVPWLQGLVTSELLELEELGAGQWSCATDVNGRIVSDLRLLHLPGMLFVDVEPGALSGGFYTHLDQQIIMEDVSLADRSDATGRIGVYGPEATDIVEATGDWEHSIEELEPFDGTWGRVGDFDVIVQRLRLTGEPGYDLSFDRAAARTVWEVVERAGGERVAPAGGRAVETARIEAGVARFGSELTEETIPLEAGLDDLVSFDKGCYTGQEVIARLDTLGTPAKRLRTLIFEGGAAPRVGAALEDGDREVGEVVNSVWSPLLDAPIALAYAKRGSNEIGDSVVVEGREAEIEQLGYALTRN